MRGGGAPSCRTGGAGRRFEVDALKVLGALFVAIYHYGVFDYGVVDPSIPNLYLRSFLSCNVPIFLFASGLLFANKGYSVKACCKRALKLLFLTLFWASVFWPINSIVEGGETAPFMLGEWVSGVLTLEMHRVNWLWFLPLLGSLYLVLPFLLGIKRANRSMFRLLVAGVCLCSFGFDAISRSLELVGLAIGSQAPSKLAHFVGLFNPLPKIFGYSLAFLSLGMLVSDRRWGESEVKLSAACLVLAPALLACFALCRIGLTGQAYDATGAHGSLAALLVTVSLYVLTWSLFQGGRAGCAANRTVRFLGSNAMAVYILHAWVSAPIRSAFLPLFPGVWRHVVGMLVAVAALFVCAGIGDVVSRSRIGRWLFSV